MKGLFLLRKGRDYEILVLDESGVVDSDVSVERYFVLGGILYDLDILKKSFIPKLEQYRRILECRELKSSKLSGRKKDSNLIYGSILGHLSAIESVKTIIYVLDKKSSYLMDYYNKKSFRYNKVIQWMIQDLIINGLVNKNDEIKILLDNITLSKTEERNIKSWLPSNVKQVSSLDMADSKEYNFIQLADLIAGIPKLKKTTPKNIVLDTKIQILKPDLIHIFPNSESRKYL